MATEYFVNAQGQTDVRHTDGNPELRAFQKAMFRGLSNEERRIIAGWEIGLNCLHGHPTGTCTDPECIEAGD